MKKSIVSLVVLAASIGLVGCEQYEQDVVERPVVEEPIVADPYQDQQVGVRDQQLREPYRDEQVGMGEPYRDDQIGDRQLGEPIDDEAGLREPEPFGVERTGGLEEEEGLRQTEEDGLRQTGRDRTRTTEPAARPGVETTEPQTTEPATPETEQASASPGAKQGVATLHSSEGEKAGVVRFTEQDGEITMKAELQDVASLQEGATVRIAEHGNCDSLMMEKPTAAASEPSAETQAAGKDLASTELTFESGQKTAEKKLTGVELDGSKSMIGHALVIESKGESKDMYCGVVGIDPM